MRRNSDQNVKKVSTTGFLNRSGSAKSIKSTHSRLSQQSRVHPLVKVEELDEDDDVADEQIEETFMAIVRRYSASAKEVGVDTTFKAFDSERRRSTIRSMLSPLPSQTSFGSRVDSALSINKQDLSAKESLRELVGDGNEVEVSKQAFQVMKQIRHDTKPDYTVDDFMKDTHNIWIRMRRRSTAVQQAAQNLSEETVHQGSAVNFLNFLALLEEKRQNDIEEEEIENSKEDYWYCMRIFLAIGPVVLLFSAVIIGAVCNRWMVERDLATFGTCVPHNTSYAIHDVPCFCGSCSGRRSRIWSCYDSYPCLIVNLTFTSDSGDVVEEGFLSGVNRSTQCAFDLLEPCYHHDYLNRRDVREFERSIQDSFPCFRHELYPQQFSILEDIDVPSEANIVNCIFWPGTLVVCVIAWFGLAINEAIRGIIGKEHFLRWPNIKVHIPCFMAPPKAIERQDPPPKDWTVEPMKSATIPLEQPMSSPSVVRPKSSKTTMDSLQNYTARVRKMSMLENYHIAQDALHNRRNSTYLGPNPQDAARRRNTCIGPQRRNTMPTNNGALGGPDASSRRTSNAGARRIPRPQQRRATWASVGKSKGAGSDKALLDRLDESGSGLSSISSQAASSDDDLFQPRRKNTQTKKSTTNREHMEAEKRNLLRQTETLNKIVNNKVHPQSNQTPASAAGMKKSTDIVRTDETSPSRAILEYVQGVIQRSQRVVHNITRGGLTQGDNVQPLESEIPVQGDRDTLPIKQEASTNYSSLSFRTEPSQASTVATEQSQASTVATEPSQAFTAFTEQSQDSMLSTDCDSLYRFDSSLLTTFEIMHDSDADMH